MDGIREELITDISLTLGSDTNIFEINEKHCKKLKIQNPVISKQDLDKIKNNNESFDYQVSEISILYDISKGVNGLEEALEDIVEQASKAIDNGTNIIILLRMIIPIA